MGHVTYRIPPYYSMGTRSLRIVGAPKKDLSISRLALPPTIVPGPYYL